MTDKVREFFKFGLEIITDHKGNILNIIIILPQSEYYICTGQQDGKQILQFEQFKDFKEMLNLSKKSVSPFAAL